MNTRREMLRRAELLGLYVDSYSPGDGVTRYRFFTEETDYFAGDGVGTALGVKDAMTFLDGYSAAKFGGYR